MKEITKRYKNGTIGIKNFSLDLRENEIYVILGSNGSGKSTLIKIIVTILKPTTGKILIDDVDMWSNNFKDIQRIKRQIGYQPETPFIFNKLYVEEYLEFITSLYGISARQKDKIMYYLDIFDLIDSRDKYLETYSFGMQKKVAFISAIIHSPNILILDEPTEGLDPECSYKIKKILQEYRNDHRIVLFTTHRLEIAEMIATKIVIVGNGSLLYVGTIDELKNIYSSQSAKLEDLYLKLVTSK